MVCSVAGAAQVVINELMYNPPSGLDGDEFIELYNAGGTAEVLDGWCFDGVVFCFPGGTTLQPGEFLLLSSDPVRTMATYGVAADFTYLLRLDDNAERLALVNGSGGLEDEVIYSDRDTWPVTPDGLGPSLEVIDPLEDNATPRNWHASTAPGNSTPRAVNSVNAVGLPPLIDQLFIAPDPAPSTPIQITVYVLGATSVDLHYIVGFGSEVTVPMADDGNSGDGNAGDLTWGVVLPGQPAGTPIRMRISAVGANGTMNLPRDDDTVTYTGTAVLDPSLQTSLPTLHWFMDDSPDGPFDRATCLGTAPDCHGFTDLTEPALLFFEGRFHDDIQVRLRGQSSRAWPKPPWKFIFNRGHNFDAPNRLERSVDNFNLQSNYSDKSFMREIMAWETLAQAGSPASQIFPVRVQLNGQFFGLFNVLETPDRDWVERNRLSLTAARYKAFANAAARTIGELEGQYEKKSRLEEDYSDLFDFLDSLGSLTGDALGDFFLDETDIPSLINYLAVMAVIHNNDHISKNYYFYRDTDGTQRWTMHAWDMDLTFGRNFLNPDGVLNDTIWADIDQLPGLPSASPSHPLFGTREHGTVNSVFNHLIDRFLAEDTLREMYFRRLRTLMDEFLTPGIYEKRVDELAVTLGDEAALDKAAWGEYGTPQTLATAAQILKDEYLALRRIHLFNTHSVCEIPPLQTPLPRVVINEIMYMPGGGLDHEFVELYNPSPTEAIDLSGWRLEGVGLNIPAGTVILPDDFVLFVRNDTAFRAEYGGGKFIGAQYTGSLADVGESLVLRDADSREVTGVTFGAVAPWPTTPAGAGPSLELIDPASDTARVVNWAASLVAGGTPGAPNSALGPSTSIPDLWINEVIARNDTVNQDPAGDFDEWIEIYNPTSATIALGGMTLTNDLGLAGLFTIPGGVEICGGCFLIFWADNETGEGDTHTNFTLDPFSGTVALYTAGGTLIDYLSYDGIPKDNTRGRFPDGSAAQRTLSIPTAEAPNQVPTFPVILNEYNAVAPTNFLKNANSDSFWGRIPGNGGDWFELVITQDHVDMRAWKLDIVNGAGGPSPQFQQLQFGASAVLADLRAGTILTISENLPNDFSYFPPAGDWTINFQFNFETGNDNWQLTILDNNDNLMFGPAGEGINPVSGIGSDEIFKLEEDPGDYITPLADYNDGSSSTFGAPNIYGGGSQLQDFTSLRAIGLSEPCPDPDGDGDSFCDSEDNCPSDANPGQEDTDGDFIGDACDTCPLDALNDGDADGVCGDVDNCPVENNPSQVDGDADGIGDVCDNCPGDFNPGQEDFNNNGVGDVCDTCPFDPNFDIDGDGVCGDVDNCPAIANASQADSDGDGAGDPCDPCPGDALDDIDLDGVCADVDTCPTDADPLQGDVDGDGVGDLCDICPLDSDPAQTDTDGDGVGDACDDDDDNDGLVDTGDNCPLIANPDQSDTNGDGQGDACDDDDDGDGIPDVSDNCPLVANAGQVDGDGDGAGDACDCNSAVGSVSVVPGQVTALRLGKTPVDVTLEWNRPFQGYVSNVYRGTLAAGQPWSYDDLCVVANVAAATAADVVADPAVGEGYYYLVSGENVCGEGPYGEAGGNAIFPVTACPVASGDTDGDGVDDTQDNCGGQSNASQDDPDQDFVGTVCDNCPVHANPTQDDFDLDGAGDVCDPDDDGDNVDDLLDNCVGVSNTAQTDSDGDGLGDACDPCTDSDGDGLADPGFASFGCDADPYPTDPENDADGDGIVGAADNCLDTANPDQSDADLDGVGDACDSCPDDPNNDEDGDGLCAGHCGALVLDLDLDHFEEVLLAAAGDGTAYLANTTDPGLGLSWTLPGFDDAGWNAGTFGLGYEAATGAESLIATGVPVGTRSVYTRTEFNIVDTAAVQDMFITADYDDAYVAWINGVEVFRSPEMPVGAPAWNSAPQSHESSNGVFPLPPPADISAVGIDALVDGTNVLAIGVWNHQPFTPPSNDLVLVPRLSINRTPTIAYLANESDPGLGITWVEELFDDSGWQRGIYGIGYDANPDAGALINTEVPLGARSIYTRARFKIDSLDDITQVLLAVDYDDGAIAWINGQEIFRFEEMPPGDPDWDTTPQGHESSNGAVPDHSSPVDVTVTALPAMKVGVNVFAVGVYNSVATSTDLVLWPALSTNGPGVDNCGSVANVGQEDADQDGVGDVCDNCVDDFNAGQFDSDGGGLGDACDNCPFDVNPGQGDMDADTVGDACDNCPLDPNPDQSDIDGNGIGDACDTSASQEVEPNDDCATANPVVLGETVLGSLASSEYDYYSITLTADTTFEVVTAGDPGGDTVVGVFDSMGNVLVGCDDDNTTPGNFYSQFSCCLPPGDYCIGLKGFDADPIQNYSVAFRDKGTCTADPDPTMNGCVIENTFGACDPF